MIKDLCANQKDRAIFVQIIVKEMYWSVMAGNHQIIVYDQIFKLFILIVRDLIMLKLRHSYFQRTGYLEEDKALFPLLLRDFTKVIAIT